MINYFSGAPPGEREKWFQYIIGQIYQQYAGQNIGLKEMNKRAIDVMLQTLSPPPHMQQAPPHSQARPHSQAPPPSQQFTQLKSHSQQSLNDQFSRRQAEYDLMVKKETPTPTFTENVKDEAIVDLNSAVEAYKRNRNEDADIVIPKPKDLDTGPKAVDVVKPMEKLDLSNAQPISLVVEEFPSKKNVQWGNNTEHVFDNTNSIIQNNIDARLTAIEKDIRDMKSTLLEILAKLN